MCRNGVHPQPFHTGGVGLGHLNQRATVLSRLASLPLAVVVDDPAVSLNGRLRVQVSHDNLDKDESPNSELPTERTSGYSRRFALHSCGSNFTRSAWRAVIDGGIGV